MAFPTDDDRQCEEREFFQRRREQMAAHRDAFPVGSPEHDHWSHQLDALDAKLVRDFGPSPA